MTEKTNLNLLSRLTHKPTKHPQTKPTHPIQQIPLPQHAHMLGPRILRPPIQRNLEHRLVHIHKPHLAHPLPDQRAVERLPVGQLRGGGELARPAEPAEVLGHGAVLAGDEGGYLLALEPAVGLEVVEGAAEDLVFHVGPAGDGQAGVDEVEFGGVVPGFGVLVWAGGGVCWGGDIGGEVGRERGLYHSSDL